MSKKTYLEPEPTEVLQEEPLALHGMVKAGIGLVVVIATMVGFFAWVNQARRQDVINRYTKSVEQFVQDNTTSVEQLFTQTMDACQSKFESDKTATRNNYLESIECNDAKNKLDSLNKQAIKDFSATAYIRAKDGNTELLEASGRYHRNQQNWSGYRSDSQNDMHAYVFEGKDINRWQDFVYYLPGKEVVVPIERNGQKIGYMLLSVIEK